MTDIEFLTTLYTGARAAMDEAYAAYSSATEAYRVAVKNLEDGLIARGGWTVGGEVKLANGETVKIGMMRFDAYRNVLTAHCRDRTVAGAWSKSARRTVVLAALALPNEQLKTYAAGIVADDPLGR